MRKFTQLMLTLTLMIVGVGKTNALEPVYPALKTYDLSLDATKWTSGWNATATKDGANLAITLTGGYGAKGIPLTDAAQPMSAVGSVSAHKLHLHLLCSNICCRFLQDILKIRKVGEFFRFDIAVHINTDDAR